MAVNNPVPACRAADLPLYLAGGFLSEAAALALSVSVGWTVYQKSHAPLALGLIGLVQFVPMLLLTLPAGELCDRLSPRRVLIGGLLLECLCAAALPVLMRASAIPLWPVYLVLFLLGVARAFRDPAGQALLPLLVRPEQLPRAIASGSSVWQIALMAGPLLGGGATALGPNAAYGLCALGFLMAALCAAMLGGRQVERPTSATLNRRIERIAEGVRFIFSRPILLGALSLDLFAVLLGGAVTLLPVYAHDILHAGPAGLGILRSAPAVGAAASALVQIRRPPARRVGLTLFAAVALFGVATLFFALSRSFAVSLAALFVLGATDMVSVTIRNSLVQLSTPDDMRGRVSAVNMLFIGASSELGGFESGLAASLIGVVPAVILGGVGTLMIAAVWMHGFPALRNADRLA